MEIRKWRSGQKSEQTIDGSRSVLAVEPASRKKFVSQSSGSETIIEELDPTVRKAVEAFKRWATPTKEESDWIWRRVEIHLLLREDQRLSSSDRLELYQKLTDVLKEQGNVTDECVRLTIEKSLNDKKSIK